MNGQLPSDPNRRWEFILLVLIGALVLPAFLVNLGDHTMIDDEGIRSLVAFEMMESGDYIHTTMNGEAYFKKPPLYNWILVTSFWLTGRIDEWTTRLPTVFFLFSFAFLIFSTIRTHMQDTTMAFLVAAMTLTSGRVLFWDSFLGLIDMAFSLTIYGLFIWLYHHRQVGRWWSYFIGAWLIAAVGFLLKGLPAVVFLGFSILAHLAYLKAWRKILHPGQFIGALLFLILVGGYYWLRLDGSDPATVFGTLYTESAQRTPTHHHFAKVIRHTLTFPLEMTYHFLPWSLLLLFIWPLGTVLKRLDHPFLRFNLLMIAANLPVYWISPDVYPRYLMMFIPLFAVMGYVLYIRSSERARRFLWYLLGGIALLIALTSWLPLLLPQTKDTPGLIMKVALLMTLTSFAAVSILRRQNLLLCGLVLQLLTLRLAFDWFVIPDRIKNDFGTIVRDDARRIGSRFQDAELVYLDQIVGSPTTWFYLNTTRQAITPLKARPLDPGQPFIAARTADLPADCVVLDTMHIRHGDRDFVWIAQWPN